MTKSLNDAFLGTYSPRQVSVAVIYFLLSLSVAVLTDVLEDNGRAARGKGEGRSLGTN